MSNLLRLLAVGTLLLLVTSIPAQTFSEKNNDRNIIPPPPTEGALGKYGYYPVSMYSGLPNISIPLFEVKDKNLTLPISLSYHASGIKVDEIASWVGLGWSLNAGGVISRTVVGSPDEWPGESYWAMAKSMIDPNSSLINAESYTPPINIVYEASQGFKDFEPDMFSFNFMGYSGSFLVDPFDWDNDNVRECHIYPQVNITIRYENGAFKAVDYNGVEYSFSVKNSLSTTNKTRVNGGNENSSTLRSHTSTWFLTRIYDPNSQAEIKLTYAPVTEKYDYTRTFSIGKSFSDNVNLEKRIRTLSQGTSSSYYLDSIICKNEFVKFNREANRIDLPEELGCSLSSIEKGRFGDTRRVKYTFGYGYFSNGLSPDIHRTRRLKLDNIILKGENGEFGGVHRFSYYSDMLPERGSFHQDYWGYFNNKPNTTPIPPFKLGDQGADLSPDATGIYMQANTLKTISYPTGGSSEFIYEPHDYSNDNGVDIPLTTTILETTPHQKDIEVTYTELTLIPPPLSYVVDFDLPADMIVHFYFDIDWEFYDVGLTKDGIKVPISSKISSQQILLTQGHYDVLLRLSKPASNPDDEPESAKVTIIYFTESTRTETIKALPSGGLRIKEIKNTSDVGKHSIKRYSYLLGSNHLRSSGVRSDFRPKYSSVENEIYQDPFVLGYSSRLWDMKFGRNQYCYALTSGSTVGYREVKESESDLDANGNEVSNGFTVYRYTSCVDIRDGSYGVVSSIGGEDDTTGQPIYGPNTDIDVVKDDADYLRGRLTSKIVYNANQFPIKKEEFTYTPPTTTYLIPGLRFSTNGFEIFGPTTPFLEQHCILTFTRYFRSVQKSVLSSKRESLYVGLSAENGQMYNVNTTDYSYNRNQQVTSERVTPITLPASTLEKKTYYPDMTTEIPSGLPGLDANLLNLMEAKNMLAIPVFTEQFKGNTCVNRVVNQFYDIGGDVLLKGRYNFDFKDGMYYNTVSFNHSDRNIVDVYKEGDLNESYYWGYSERYPVVKAVNAPYGTLSSAIYTTLNSLATPFSSLDALLSAIAGPYDTRWRDFNESLRSNSSLAGCPITTYTYDPVFGVTSQTDPNGLTTCYEYDGLGRLHLVKDNDGNILKSYDYHYKGFKPKIITSTVGPGSISPQNPEVELGHSISLTILPNPGYHVKHLTVNGIPQSAALSYSFQNVTSDQTLVAEFEISSYTVTFNSQGGSAVPSVNASYNTTIAAPAAPTLDGHTFGDWFRDAACTVPWSFANDAVTSDITLYASWTINTYAVTFDPQGGSPVAGISAIYNTKISPPTSPTRADLTFGGWFKETGCINTWDFNNDLIVANTTLYAKWVCTVWFDSQGGTLVAPMVVECNAKIIQPTDPTQTCYNFWGWYKESSGYNSWNFDAEHVSKNTTLYARWNPQQRTVTISKSGNGTVKRNSDPNSPEDLEPIQVDCNGYISFYFYPAVGKSVRVNGAEVTARSEYMIRVIQDITLNVEFYTTPPPATYLTVSPESLNFGPDGGSGTLHITSNVSWTVSYSDGLMGPSSGSNDADITVNCPPILGSTDPPSITITGGGITVTIQVTKEYE